MSRYGGRSAAASSKASSAPGSASGNAPGSRSPSPWTPVIRSATPPSVARRLNPASASGLASTTVTRCPASASGTAKPPVPPPTSSTMRRVPRSSSARSAAHTTAVRGVSGRVWVRSTSGSLVGRYAVLVQEGTQPLDLVVEPVQLVEDEPEVQLARPAGDLARLLLQYLLLGLAQRGGPVEVAAPDRGLLAPAQVGELLVELADPHAQHREAQLDQLVAGGVVGGQRPALRVRGEQALRLRADPRRRGAQPGEQVGDRATGAEGTEQQVLGADPRLPGGFLAGQVEGAPGEGRQQRGGSGDRAALAEQLLDPRAERGDRDPERGQHPDAHPVTGVDQAEQQVTRVYPVVPELTRVRLGGDDRGGG